MKSKSTASSKKQPVAVKDLTTKKSPKGGVLIGLLLPAVQKTVISDQAAAGNLTSFRR